MTTHDALLAAVLANPADDLPRLVLADWYEEHGQPERAEFIRVQCSPSASTSDIARVLGGTGTDWVTAGVGNPNDWSWSGGLMTCYDDPVEVATSVGVVLSYVRGFVSEVRCRLADWCGGECGRCGGSGGRRVDRPDVCPTCHGTGRTTGIGPRLVREHPVERVVVTDIIQTRVENRLFGREPITWHRVTRDQAGQLENFFVLFQRGDREFAQHIETASLPMLQKFVSAAAIAWAKAQPPHVSTSPVSADVTR